MNRLRLLFFAFFSIAMLSACPDWKSIGEGFAAIEIGGSSGSEEVPGEEVPGEEVPGEEVPGEEIPGEEIPGEEIPGEEIPGEEIPGEEIPGEEIPNSSHKVQLRLRFDITDSSGGLWQDDFTHVTGLEFQYDAFGTTAVGYLINGADHPDGYIANYGFCGKYGITEQSMFWDKRDTARYKSGIDYYIGHVSVCRHHNRRRLLDFLLCSGLSLRPRKRRIHRRLGALRLSDMRSGRPFSFECNGPSLERLVRGISAANGS